MDKQDKIILEIQDNQLTKKGNAAIIDFYQTMSIDQLKLPGIFAAVTEMDNPFLNVVIDIRDNRNNSSTQIEACRQFFAKHNIPWAWFVTPGSENNDLTQHGFSLLEKAPAMYFDLHTPIPKLKNYSIIIQEASATNDLKKWIEPINEGFDAKPDDDSYLKLNANLLNNGCKKLRHFVGYHDNSVVSSGTLFVSNDSAMLHNLATKPAYTKRGFGTALTLHMMQCAKEMGIQHFFLDSSADGVSIYRKIGFKIYSTTIVYSQEQTKS